MNKYSVLMSLYHKERADFFSLAIESMINQTVKPNEIVIVEDGILTKPLYETLEYYSKQYPSLIKRIVNKENIGLGLSLKKGVEFCKNQLIARMDTDDISCLDRCEKQLRCFEINQNLSLCSGHIAEFINEPNEVIGFRKVPISNYDIKKEMKKRCPFNHMAVMFKKEDVLKAGNYMDFFWNEDYFLWIRMLENGCEFINLDEIVVNVRTGEGMYKRRGGMKYFVSEYKLQKLMLEKNMNTYLTFSKNVIIRFIVQILCPSFMRKFIYMRFARCKS